MASRGSGPPEVTDVRHNFIRNDDWQGGEGWIYMIDPHLAQALYWVAPAPYLGDQTGQYGRVLFFRLASDKNSEYASRVWPRVILVGNGGDSLFYKDSTLKMPVASPIFSKPRFQSYWIPLNEGVNWKIKRPTLSLHKPSRIEFCAVLNQLTSLMIQAEFTKAKETDVLDDVEWGAALAPVDLGHLCIIP
jgi:hypothetical protein